MVRAFFSRDGNVIFFYAKKKLRDFAALLEKISRKERGNSQCFCKPVRKNKKPQNTRTHTEVFYKSFVKIRVYLWFLFFCRKRAGTQILRGNATLNTTKAIENEKFCLN